MSNPCILCKTCKETNPEAVFHRFPRTKTRCQRWLNALQLDVIKDKTPRELYKSFRLCSNHFSPKNYLTGTHFPGLRESACPDQNLDQGNIPHSTAAAENITSESNSPSNLPNDSGDHRCSQREECAPSEIQIFQQAARHPTSRKGPRPWRYQEASASSSTLQASAATCNSSSVPSSRARHQTTYKTTGEHSHPEEHVGPFRFTDPISTVENKVALQRTNLVSLQRDSESDASETEDTICEMVSQSTQTNTSAPKEIQDLSAPPSQTETKATKVMNQSATETRAINIEQDETTTQRKETNGTVESETSPAIHTTPGEGSGSTLHSYNLSPKASLTAKNSLDGANSNNQLTSEINNSVQKIVIDDENIIEIDETGSLMYSNSSESEGCEKQKPSEERTMQRTYSGPVRRQVVKTKEGSKRTYMILKRASLKTLQKKGIIQQVKNNTGNGRPSSSWSSTTYSKTFLPPTQLQQNQEKKRDESSSGVVDSACAFSFQELVNSNSTDTIEQFSLVDSSVEPVLPLDLSPLYIPPLDVTPLDDPPLDRPPLDEPPLDEPPLDEPPLDEPPLDEPPLDEPPLDEPPLDEPLLNKPLLNKPLLNKPLLNQPLLNKPLLNKPLLNKPPLDEPPLDVQIPPNPVTSQSSETPYSSHTASVALGTPSSQGNQIPVVVTWSGTSVTDAQSFSFTIKLSDQMDKCAIVQNTAAKGSVSKDIVLKGPCPLTDPAEGSCNMNQQISSTTADQPDPLSYIGKGSCVDPGPSCSTTSKLKSRWNLSQTSVVCFPSEDEELSCDSPPPIDSSDPLELSEGPSQSKMETVEHLDRIMENDYPTNKGKMCRYDKGGSESTLDATKGVQWVALPTESVTNTYNHSQSPKRTPVCESSTQDLEDFYETAKHRLKDRYKQLLNKHRQRYCQLLRKYKSLERKCHLSHYIGTREQIVRDAKRYLAEEHILFLESQMFLRNRTGTGNRFSKKFIRFMMSLYERSSAGYKFLRTIFTIPSIKTIHKWQSRPYDILEESQKDPLEIIVDTREVETIGGGISGDTEYRQENLAVSYSMEAIQREFFPSTMHFKDAEEFEEGESSCEISDDSLDSEVLDDVDHSVGDHEEEEEEMEEEELAENAELIYGNYTYK
ncbi:cell surface glycoprotein 1-like [Penaeus chinensis]|uniref:cell surface glycoprotein 1-like n=1 Tax=Penaeus chinensis TaxID=139456 RepID=UPI001FB70363|nr:cell surface glycoprotein 1-like [Penaeus chinensis]